MAVDVEIFSRNMNLSERLSKYVTGKASKLDRYLTGIEETRVDLAYVKSARSVTDRQVAQITVRGKKFILRSEERSDDIFAAFDQAMDKMQRQMERYKGKRNRGRGDGTSLSEAIVQAEEPTEETAEEPGSDYVIARRKKFQIQPMDEMEAIDQMNLLGHESFFIFFNFDTNAINVLYKRRDGTYGLIEPELS